MKTIPMMEARTAALVSGLSVGLGLVVHPGFFLIVAAVVLIVVAQWTANEIYKLLGDFARTQSQPHHFGAKA